MTPDKARDKLDLIYANGAPNEAEQRIFDGAVGALIGCYLYTREEAEEAMLAYYRAALKRRNAPKKRPVVRERQRNHQISRREDA